MPGPSAEVMDVQTSAQRGFTLIEVVVAVFILSSAIVAWMVTFGTELRTLARARQAAVAVELAEDRLTAVELFGLDYLPSLPDSLEEGLFAAPFADYRWEADAVSVSGRDLAEVSVVVTGPGVRHALTTVLPLRSLRTTVR